MSKENKVQKRKDVGKALSDHCEELFSNLSETEKAEHLTGYVDFLMAEFEHARAHSGVQEDLKHMRGISGTLSNLKKDINKLSPHNKMRLASLTELLPSDPNETLADLIKQVGNSLGKGEKDRTFKVGVNPLGKASIVLKSGEELSPNWTCIAKFPVN